MPRISARIIGNEQEATTVKAMGGKRTVFVVRGCPGLILEVTPARDGGKDIGVYRFIYRIGGRSQQIKRSVTLKNRRDQLLSEARRETDALRIRVADGESPADDGAQSAAAVKFREMCEQRYELDQRPGIRTLTEYKRLIAVNAMNDLGEMPADDVSEVQIARVLDKVAKRSPHQADRTRDAIRSTYAWAKGRKLVRSNPASGHAKRAVEIPRDRFYTTIELRKLTNMLRAEQSSVCTILRLLLLTGQRETMVAGAEDAELDTNLKTWTIAGDTSRGGRRIKGRMKKGREQIVPLSTQATELFQEALQTQRDSYVFPADLGRVPAKRVRPRTPSINGQSVSRALRKFNAALEIEDANVHDFRRTIARWLSDQEVRPDVIDAILAHAPRDVGGRHYGKRAPESMIRSALQLWADHLDYISVTPKVT